MPVSIIYLFIISFNALGFRKKNPNASVAHTKPMNPPRAWWNSEHSKSLHGSAKKKITNDLNIVTLNNLTACEHRQIGSEPLSFLQSSMSRCQGGPCIMRRIQCSVVFPPPVAHSLAGFCLRFSMKALHCFLLSLLLWPDGSITSPSRKSMNRQSKGDSSHGAVPDALVYSRGVRDIYWQKFNGLGENFPKRSIFGRWWWWKGASVCSPNKRNILDLALCFLVYIVSLKYRKVLTTQARVLHRDAIVLSTCSLWENWK